MRKFLHPNRLYKQRIIFLALIVLNLTGCDRLAKIPYSPEQTPESWLQIQPYVEINIGVLNFILIQPSSTVFVYLLGIIAIGVGLYFLRIKDGQKSRKWWGIAFLLWGSGSLCAGTSYQAFSFEIKCSGQSLCSWTSWWEIFYLLLSAGSVAAMVISGAYSSCSANCRQGLIRYAFLNMALYCVVILIGVVSLTKFLISFGMLLIFTVPSILLLFILNSWRYYRYRNGADLAFVITWLWLGLTIGIYFITLILGMTDILWARGYWFSENDVLHIGLISWVLYIGISLAERITDHPNLDFVSSLNSS